MLFDPFDSWSDSNPNILDNYDPDLNYYESSSVRQYSNSDYYDIDQFNDNMKDVAGLSMLHCNIRSATHNSSSLGDYLMSLKHEFEILYVLVKLGSIKIIRKSMIFLTIPKSINTVRTNVGVVYQY